MSSAPELSVVIPVYNEEGILRAAVTMLMNSLDDLGATYEVILTENGSTDETLTIARELGAKWPRLHIVSIPQPNYGRALREGILAARGEFVICDEIDLCDTKFHEQALRMLRQGEADLIVGSKLAGGAADERPLWRHTASLVYTGLLRLLVGFTGTDTHGVKGFRREKLLEVVEACLVDRDVFASEFVIRAHQSRVAIQEIPVRVKEMRPPSIKLARRVPGVLSNLARLTWAIRIADRRRSSKTG